MLEEMHERTALPSGSVTLGIAYGVNKYLGTGFWDGFRSRYENTRLNLTETADRQVEQMLGDEVIDLGISSCAYDRQKYRGQKLFSVPVHVLCSAENSLYGKKSISLTDLNGQRTVTLSDKYKSPAFLRSFLVEHHIEADMSLCTSEMSYIWDLCY